MRPTRSEENHPRFFLEEKRGFDPAIHACVALYHRVRLCARRRPESDLNPTVTLSWQRTVAASCLAKVSTDLSDCEKKIGESLTAEDDENPEDAGAHQRDLRAVRGSFIQDEGRFLSHRGRVKGDWERLVFRDSGMQGCLIPSVWRNL